MFAALEDNVVSLSTMKASRYFAVFEREICYWEQSLSLVSEAIETILQVRRRRREKRGRLLLCCMCAQQTCPPDCMSEV